MLTINVVCRRYQQPCGKTKNQNPDVTNIGMKKETQSSKDGRRTKNYIEETFINVK